MCSRSATKAIAAALRCWARRSAAARTSTSTGATRSRSSSGEAMAANRVTHMIDPWPRGQRPAQHRLQRREGGDRGRALPHRPRHPAGQRHHQLGRLHARRSRQAQSAANNQASSAPSSRRHRPAGPSSSRTIRARPSMRSCEPTSAANKTGVAVLTADPAFEQSVRSTFGASAQIELRMVLRHDRRAPATGSTPKASPSSIIDLDAGRDEEMAGAGAADAPHRRAGRRSWW